MDACRADGEWRVLSRHRSLVSRDTAYRFPRGEAATESLAIFVSAITRSKRSRFRQLTKRSDTRSRWTEHGPQPDAEDGWVHPPSKVAWTHPSNEARYVTGVLGMTGGFVGLANFLAPFPSGELCQAWRDTKPPGRMVLPPLSPAEEITEGAAFDLRSEGERQRFRTYDRQGGSDANGFREL